MERSEKNEAASGKEATDAGAESIANFEAMGSAIFNVETDADIYEALLDYIRRNGIATYTDVDEANGIITITKRPMGSLEAL